MGELKIGWVAFCSISSRALVKGHQEVQKSPFLRKKIRENFPISLHSVGNSLGSANSLDKIHLKNLKKLIDIIDPTPRTVDALSNLDLPAGVSIEIKM